MYQLLIITHVQMSGYPPTVHTIAVGFASRAQAEEAKKAIDNGQDTPPPFTTCRALRLYKYEPGRG